MQTLSPRTCIKLASQILRPLSCKYSVTLNIRGIVPPVFTALNDDRTVNFNVIPTYAKYLAANGMKAILVGGSTGEHPTLSVGDRKKAITSWINAAKSVGIDVIVQTGGAPYPDVLELSKHSEAAGAVGILVLPELYYKPQTVSAAVTYLESVSKVAPTLPILYYHIPAKSKVELNMVSFVKEATKRIPNFKGLKFTSNDLSAAAEVKRALQPDQELFLGADTILAPAGLVGIRSSIATTYSHFPKLALGIQDALNKSDLPTAAKLQAQLTAGVDAMNEGPRIPLMKEGFKIVTGIDMGPGSVMERRLKAEEKTALKNKLKSLGLVG